MSDQTSRLLDETFRERTDALPPADLAPVRLMRAARSRQRRQRAYGALGGAAAAAVVVALALQSGQVSSAPPVPAATSNPLETALTVDQVARANASHAWAISLPAGPAEDRQLGYEVARRGDRVAVILDGGEALLPPEVRAVSSPTKAADGWHFIGHPADSRDESGVSRLGTMVLEVSDDLSVRMVTEADVVASILPSPDGRGLAVVTGHRNGDTVEYDTALFILGSGDTMDVPLPDQDAAAIGTWDGDQVTFLGSSGGPASSRVHVYDLAQRSWRVEDTAAVLEGDANLSLVATPVAQGGSAGLAFVAVDRPDSAPCLHLMRGSRVEPEALACSEGANRSLVARVSPGGRFTVVGDGWNGRVNTGAPASIIDLTDGRELAKVPGQLRAVGAQFLIWEDEHTLVGQATRATPVHDAATLFRWDLSTSSGQSLEWDPAAGPMPQSGEMSPVL